MAKVSAKMADIATTFVPAAPDDYELLIEKMDMTSNGGRDTVKYEIAIDQPGNEEHGKKIFGQISLHKKDGDDNTAGLAELKRFFEGVFGKERLEEEGDNFDYDTDYLVKQRVGGSVVIESYDYEKDGVRKQGQSNTITKVWAL